MGKAWIANDVNQRIRKKDITEEKFNTIITNVTTGENQTKLSSNRDGILLQCFRFFKKAPESNGQLFCEEVKKLTQPQSL